MSKSKGNGIDPLDMIDQFGADACRFWLSSVGLSGQDVRFSEEKLLQTRNFVTKVWNASRLVFMNLEGFNHDYSIDEKAFTLVDNWILTRLKEVAKTVNHSMEKYNFGDATKALYEFFWDEFCDWYLEIAKPRLKTEEKDLVQHLLVYLLDKILRMMHPIMPFITEELWEKLKAYGIKDEAQHLITAKWVTPEDLPYSNLKAKEDMDLVVNVVRSIRNLRSEFSVPAATIVENILIFTANEEKQNILKAQQAHIFNLSRIKALVVNPSSRPESAVSSVISDVEVVLPLGDLVDVEKEKARINKEIEKITQQRDRTSNQLKNEAFVSRAAPEVVEKAKKQLEELELQKGILEKKLELFK